MSEHELSTMLRDHLSDEPPVAVTSAGAIRTGRRQSRARLAVGGVAAVAVLGLAAATVPGLVSDDANTTAHESAGFAAPTEGTYTDRLQAVAQDELGPLVDGGLGTADLFVTNVDAEEVPSDSPDVQGVVANYALGDTVVNVSALGVAPEEFATLHAQCDPAGGAVTCDQDTLADGSTVTTQVTSFETFAGVMRALSPSDAADHPDQAYWGRWVQVDTPSGLTIDVAEYVKAPTLADVEWQLPVDALRSVATDPSVLDPTGLAHAPICSSAHTSC